MYDFFALMGFDVLDSAFRASIVAATTPNIGPFFTIIWTVIIIDELLFRHSPSFKLAVLVSVARREGKDDFVCGNSGLAMDQISAKRTKSSVRYSL